MFFELFLPILSFILISLCFIAVILFIDLRKLRGKLLEDTEQDKMIDQILQRTMSAKQNKLERKAS